MKARLGFVVVCFFVLIGMTNHAQSTGEVDSLILLLESDLDDTTRYNVYYELFRMHIRRDLPAAKKYLEEEMMLANQLKDDERIVRSKNHQGIYLSTSNQYDEALDIFMSIRDYYRETGNQVRESKTLTNIANVYRRLGKVKLALEAQMKSLKIDEDRGEKGMGMANNYFSLGNMHGEIFNIEASSQWYQKAAAIYKEIGNQEFLMRANHMIGLNYMIIDSLDLAIDYLEPSKEYYEQTNNPYALSMAYDNLGSIAEKKGDIKKAIELYEKSLDLAVKTQQTSLEGSVSQRLAELYTSIGRYTKGVKYGSRALEVSTELSERRRLVGDLKILAEANKGLGDINQAFYYQSRYLTLADSIAKDDNRVALEEIEVKYQTEKKEQEIILLEEKSKRDQLKRQMLIGGLVALSLLFGLIVYSLRQRVRRNKLEKEKLALEVEYSNKELEARKRELTVFAIQLANKNETLEGIKRNVKEFRANPVDGRSIQRIVNTIDFNINDDNNWEAFRQRFEAVHGDFEYNVKSRYGEMTPNELRLMALLKMNLSSKEIANILNISPEGIKKARYRLRKKLNLKTSDSLEELITSM